MEDQYSIEYLNGNLSTLYFAIFDGHGSDACAKFCEKIFPKHVRFENLLPKIFIQIKTGFCINIRETMFYQFLHLNCFMSHLNGFKIYRQFNETLFSV